MADQHDVNDGEYQVIMRYIVMCAAMNTVIRLTAGANMHMASPTGSYTLSVFTLAALRDCMLGD